MKIPVLRKSVRRLFHLFPCNLPRYFQILTGVLEFSSISMCLGICALDCLGICALVKELGKDPGYGRWDWKLAMCSSKEVRKEG